MKRMLWSLPIWSIVFMGLLLASCGSEKAVDSANDPFQQIPFPTRETAWTAQKVVDGYPAEEQSDGPDRIFDSLVAQAPPNEIEWAIYRLNGGTPTPQMNSIDITIEESGLGGATLSAWFGLADFDQGRWVFEGPYDTPPSLTLSPGASGSTTLAVTSATGATAGAHGIGVGTASAADAVHTASDSATYYVEAAGGALTESVGMGKSSYVRGEAAHMSALVKRDGVAVAGASVSFRITQPNGSTTVIDRVTGSTGYAHASYRISKGKSAIGRYAVRADASSGGSSATASTAFTVN